MITLDVPVALPITSEDADSPLNSNVALFEPPVIGCEAFDTVITIFLIGLDTAGIFMKY